MWDRTPFSPLQVAAATSGDFKSCTASHVYLTAVLEGEGGEGVVLVHPDHPVTEAAHAQHTPPRGVGPFSPES